MRACHYTGNSGAQVSALPGRAGSGSIYAFLPLFACLLLTACAQMQGAAQAGSAGAASSAAAQPQAPPQDQWPRQIAAAGNTFTIYQPQLESWDGFLLTARAAVGVKGAQDTQSTFGAVWFTAQTQVDKQNRMVTLSGFTITRSSFPAAPDKAQSYQDALMSALPASPVLLALDRLQADLETAQATGRSPVVQVQNSVPRIMFSTQLSLLVLIDGSPAVRQVQGTQLMRVINTRVLLLLDQTSSTYYLWLMNQWAQAPALDGPWIPANSPPAALDTAKQLVPAQQVNLLTNAAPDVQQVLDQGQIPAIYVSTVPAQLLQTAGQPQFRQIAGTQLKYAQNTKDNIFLYTGTQQYYALISGRWFTSASLQQGPWTYVSAGNLPQDFASIPLDSPKAAVLASVPGTPQARQAVIANSIPQTATISLTARTSVTYDGAPQFQPIAGTPLQYAVNASLPVICVNTQSYYLVDRGVWFTAPSATGPWSVATSVPSVIYTIPPGSPLHYVTYVYVYNATPQVVYTGYTPGYYGACVAPGGTVVYGTGYLYQPWVGSVWYPPPPTYGYDAGYSAGYSAAEFSGLALGFSAASAAWGPWYGVPEYNVYNDWNADVHYQHQGTYASWGTVNGNKVAQVGSTNFAKYDNNVYAAHDGNLYQRDLGGWKKYNPDTGDWNLSPYSAAKDTQKVQNYRQQNQTPENTSRSSSFSGSSGDRPWSGWQDRSDGFGGGDRFSQLDNSWRSRMSGDQRFSGFRSGGGFGGFGGGGFGGFRGGGFGGRR